MSDLVGLNNDDFWMKVVEMLQQNWAVIEPEATEAVRSISSATQVACLMRLHFLPQNRRPMLCDVMDSDGTLNRRWRPQHARQRRAVARGVVLALPPPGDPQRRPLAQITCRYRYSARAWCAAEQTITVSIGAPAPGRTSRNRPRIGVPAPPGLGRVNGLLARPSGGPDRSGQGNSPRQLLHEVVVDAVIGECAA
jgi:hypothetical protein